MSSHSIYPRPILYPALCSYGACYLGGEYVGQLPDLVVAGTALLHAQQPALLQGPEEVAVEDQQAVQAVEEALQTGLLHQR